MRVYKVVDAASRECVETTDLHNNYLSIRTSFSYRDIKTSYFRRHIFTDTMLLKDTANSIVAILALSSFATAAPGRMARQSATELSLTAKLQLADK